MQPRHINAEGRDWSLLLPCRPPAAAASDGETTLAQIVVLTVSALDMAAATVTITDHRRYTDQMRVGVSDDVPGEFALCAQVLESPSPVIIADLHIDSALGPLARAAEPAGLRSFAGVRLACSTGLGVLSVMDVRPRTLDRSELELLAALGHLAACHIEMCRAHDAARYATQPCATHPEPDGPGDGALTSALPGVPGTVIAPRSAHCSHDSTLRTPPRWPGSSTSCCSRRRRATGSIDHPNTSARHHGEHRTATTVIPIHTPIHRTAAPATGTADEPTGDRRAAAGTTGRRHDPTGVRSELIGQSADGRMMVWEPSSR
jgi:hypothetical protein